MSLKTLFVTALIALSMSAAFAKEEVKEKTSGWEAYEKLKQGNERFVEGKVKHPNQDSGLRDVLAKGQTPHSIILSCSDSRVPPELLFDQGFGDVFSIRVAGNVLSDEAVASIEYAVEHLGSRLILVMGHESCGAVKAALTTPVGKTAGSASLDKLVSDIRPYIKDSSKSVVYDDPTLKDPVKSNVNGVAKELLKRSKIVREMVESQKLVIAHGIYSLKTAKVDFWDVGQRYVFIEAEEGNARVPASVTAEPAHEEHH